MKTNREEILQHALQLFMSMNYESVSLQMIAHSVGLTKTGIFNYYPTKLDLFIAVADRYLFHVQDPENKFEPSDGSLRDFIDKYVKGVERTMAEIVRLGNIQREKMPGQLANAGYFHLFQQCSSTIPTASTSSTNGWKRSFGSGATSSPGVSNEANCGPIQILRRLPLCSGRFLSDSHTRCPSPMVLMSKFSGSASSIYMGC